MIKKIISGGQTGADQGALHGAKIAGIATGGWAPKGWQTERGPAKKYLKYYNLREFQKYGYPERTKQNIKDSDGTLIIGDIKSTGSALTASICYRLKMPRYTVGWTPDRHLVYSNIGWLVASWIKENEIEILNVAGNRESKNPGIHIATKNFIVELVAELKKGE